MTGKLLESVALSSFLFLVSFVSSSAQQSASRVAPSIDDSLREKLEAEIPRLMQEWRLPGLSISVIQDRETAWRRAFGVKSIDREAGVDDRTIFTAASLTKPVFAYAVLRMCDEGLLDLDRPLVTYAPKEYIEERFLGHPTELSGFNREWFSRITARMALSHSSGLQHFGLKRPVELLFEPGTRFQYSSNGIEYLRYVVEHLTGSRIDSVVERYVFRPLDMTHSSLSWRDEYALNAAAGHDEYGRTSGSIERFEEPTAQASLYTNADDYGKFLSAVMTGEGLTEATFSSMVTPQIEIPPNLYWGLGFGIEETNEGKGIWHWGDAGSYTSYFYGNLDRGTGFVYFSNSHYGLAILDRLFSLTDDGEHPALSLKLGDWSFADDYLSPGMAFQCKLFHGDVEEALGYFREAASASGEGEQVIDEARMGRWTNDLLRNGRIRDAMTVLRLRLDAYHPAEADRAAMGYVQAAATAMDDTKLAWVAEMVKAKREPVSIADEVLASYVGEFDPYRITREEGALFFGREGAGQIRMIPIDESTFVFEELDYFKVEMVEEEGRVVGIRGIFSTGRAEVYAKTE
jgi:CubicO group peptidase (beta-lactamase class C family)